MLKEYLNLSIILSILLIFSMTILPISTSYTDVFNLRLIPFGTTLDMFKSGNLLEFCVNIFGNIIMFIPLGFFTYIRGDDDFKTAFLICLMTTVSVEIIQMVFP
ncbi:VanZ family protein, partial [Intestinibacter sp.]